MRTAFPEAEFPECRFPHAADYHWKFLSFCFALATGVGKTRLMGAIIANLYRAKGLRNFVVVAPGKTVYEKLIADFTEGSPKYVFKGLSCFATKKPVVVTGDTYQNAAGILDGRDLLGYSVVINVFNIQKLNERVTGKKTDVTDRRVRNVANPGERGAVDEAEKLRFAQGLVAELAACNDIDYDANRELIGNLATACVDYLVGRLSATDFANCMRNNKRTLAEGLHKQILDHAVYDSNDDRVEVAEGNLRLKANTLTADPEECAHPRAFDRPIPEGEREGIRKMVFSGFSKCLFALQKFDSEPERAFSELLEREPSVLKWFKPTLSNLRLYYGPNEYTPDFVFETETEKWLCEVKAVGKVEEPVVQAKKEAALKWCHYASDGVAPGGKCWRYMLVPDTAINSSLELSSDMRVYGAP